MKSFKEFANDLQKQIDKLNQQFTSQQEEIQKLFLNNSQLQDKNIGLIAESKEQKKKIQKQEERLNFHSDQIKQLRSNLEGYETRIQTLEFGNLLVKAREDICDQLNISERKFMNKNFSKYDFDKLRNEIQNPPIWLHWRFASCVYQSIHNRNDTAHERVATLEQARKNIKSIDEGALKYFNAWSQTIK